MSFGNKLEQIFCTYTEGKTLNEIELFTKLEDSFISLKNSCQEYEISIIHGNRSHVSFEVTGDYVRGKKGTVVTRELADMMFIVVSPARKEFRLFFLQNKVGHDLMYEKKFPADLLQLDLLKFRPVFNQDGMPVDILQKAEMSSVGSYGVFYNEKGQPFKYNMAYSTAEIINPIRRDGKGVKRKVRIVGDWEATSFGTKGHRQLDSCCRLESFADGMLDMMIGTPIESMWEFEQICSNKLFEGCRPILMKWGCEFLDFGENRDLDYKEVPQRVSAKTVILLNADIINMCDDRR